MTALTVIAAVVAVIVTLVIVGWPSPGMTSVPPAPRPDRSFDAHAEQAMRVANPVPLSPDFAAWEQEIRS